MNFAPASFMVAADNAGGGGAAHVAHDVSLLLAALDLEVHRPRVPGSGRHGGPEHLVATVARAGPAESVDGGRSWRRLGGLARATWVSWGRGPSGVVVASGPDGAARCSGGGRSWERLTVPEAATIVEASPTDPAVLDAAGLVGSSARVWVSRDRARRWAEP